MLEIRPNCEHCNKDLPYNATDAMICTFECTYCKLCATTIFQNVCPNCGGGFAPRPIRPLRHLIKHPVSSERVFAPKDLLEVAKQFKKYGHVSPKDR